MKGLVFWLFIGWLFYSYTNGSLDSLITQLKIADKEISEISCSEIAIIAKGERLQNAFGMTFSILKISNVREARRTTTKLVCTGHAKFSNGNSSTLRMEVYDDSDGDRFFEYQSQ